MSLRKKSINALALTLSAVYLVSGNVGSNVLANEESSTLYSSTNEVSGSTQAVLVVDNGITQMKPNDKFDLTGEIAIKGSTYKAAMKEAIEAALKTNTDKKSNIKISGLENLNGSITYSITLPYKLSDYGRVYVDNAPIGVGQLSYNWSAGSDNNTVLTMNLPIYWSTFISANNVPSQALTDYDLFNQESDFPDLAITLQADNLRFDTSDQNRDHRPDLNQRATFSGSVNSCSIYSPNDGISLSYIKPATNSFYDQDTPKTIFGSLNKEISIRSTGNRTVTIGNKKITAPSNRPGITTPNNPSSESSLEVIRLYNPASGEHLFTSSEAERINLISNGWKVEKCNWRTPKLSGTPIFRLLNPNNGDHHYTTNVGEKDQLTKLGWVYEGAALYAADEEVVPVYRMYNPNATGVGSHHYTDSMGECNALQNFGWIYEGIAWYGLNN